MHAACDIWCHLMQACAVLVPWLFCMHGCCVLAEARGWLSAVLRCTRVAYGCCCATVLGQRSSIGDHAAWKVLCQALHVLLRQGHHALSAHHCLHSSRVSSLQGVQGEQLTLAGTAGVK